MGCGFFFFVCVFGIFSGGGEKETYLLLYMLFIFFNTEGSCDLSVSVLKRIHL